MFEFMPPEFQTRTQRRISKNSVDCKNRRNRVRDAIFEKYGCVCAHCGFDDKRALCIDHVNGNGANERRKFGSSLSRYYDYVLASNDVGKYQILCANCNSIKRIVNREN